MTAPKPKPGTEEELIGLLWAAARKGNVPAMRILLMEMRHDGQDVETSSTFDELASKRAHTAAIG